LNLGKNDDFKLKMGFANKKQSKDYFA